MRLLAVAWSATWVGFFLGWKLGRKEFAFWLVRHPNWRGLNGTHSDGALLCENCGKPMADHDEMAHCWVQVPSARSDGAGGPDVKQ